MLLRMSVMLVPCVHCARHVRSDASRCPFCDGASCVPAVSEVPDLVGRNLSRAAMIALGTTLALSNCRPTPTTATPTPDEHVTIMQPYGVPIPPPDVQPPIAPPVDVPAARIATDRAVSWEMTASASSLTMAERARWRLNIAATNHGPSAVDPERHRMSFTVNGAQSMVMDMAFGNGLRGPEWGSLPPGATARDARELGPSLFTAPGNYDITMLYDGAPVTTLHIRVR